MKITQEVNLGMALKLKRVALGLNQKDIAKKVGLSVMGLSYLERGTRYLKLETLDKWTKALGMEVEINLSNKKETKK